MRRSILVVIVFLFGLVLGIGSTVLVDEVSDDDDEEAFDLPFLDQYYAPLIRPSDFVGAVNNTYMPLRPGTKWIYEGQTDEGLEHIEVVVLNDTRTVMGVKCTIVRDTVSLDGSVVEDTYDWYAQDISGNVWYFGEDSREMEDGKVVSTAGSWEGGKDGAVPGIVMMAAPMCGMTYRQEYYPGKAEDMGTIVSVDVSGVGIMSFDDCVQTMDWTPLEPDALEYKYYAPGVGNVLETTLDGSERIELISYSRG